MVGAWECVVGRGFAAVGMMPCVDGHAHEASALTMVALAAARRAPTDAALGPMTRGAGRVSSCCCVEDDATTSSSSSC